MPADQFCLRWNNHHPNLITVFSSLLQNDQMVDVTLISENREIHAHKIVLSACSPFFQSIFLRNSCKHPVIVLTGIKYIHMKSLVDFIYNGEVNVYQNHLNELLRVANILKIKGLDEVKSSETIDIATNRQNVIDSEIVCANADDDFLSPQVEDSEDVIKQDNIDIPTTSDQAKTTKKRKSVTFSDTPEIVWDHLRSESPNDYGEYSGNGKRKLRSLSDICSITKIKKENDDGETDDVEKASKNELIVTINPHSLYSSSEIDDIQSKNSPLKKQRPSQSRKMIRKNENFLRALEAVRDEGMGFCKAAKIHGVNNRTLWLEYQKLGYPMKNPRNKPKCA